MFRRCLPPAAALLLVLGTVGIAAAATPTVAFTAPAANATVHGIITFDVTASSNTDKVEYFVDDVEVAEDTTNNGNWSEEWDSRTVADGTHEIRAKATDGSDTANVRRTITIANNTTPDNGLGSPTLNADANSNKTVDLVWTHVPGAVSYNVYEDLYNPANGLTPLANVTDTTSKRGPLADGTYRYFVTPVAADGSEGSPSNKITVTVPAPENDPGVDFNTPATDSTLSGTVTFTATCTDTEASTSLCDKVEYLIDGQLAADDGEGGNADGFNEPVDTTQYADGKHYIQARGWNGTISKTSPPRAVTFDNGVTPPDEDLAPVANFTVAPVDSDTFDFTDTSANSPTSWSWDFGDGSAAVTTQNAQHSYAAPGTYTVILTATNAAGSDTETRSVTTDTDPPEEPTDTDLRPSLPGAAGDNTMVDIEAGEQVKFNGNWYVDHAKAEPHVRIYWYVDGVQKGQALYTPQEPGVYGSESTAAWTATEGNHVIEMRMDPLNETVEANETNNSSTRAFTVKPAPVADAPPAIPASGPVRAVDETQAFASGSGDIADDPAIYVDADPSRSVVIGSKKAASGGGLAVYDLNGNQIQFLGAGELNNVDIRTVNGKVLVLTTERGSNTLKFFFFDPATRTLTNAGSFAAGFEPYGGCLYQAGANLYGFVTNRNSPWDFDQYQLTVGASAVTGAKVRDLTTSSLSESCVADDEAGGVFLSQETSGVYRYNAAPSGGSARTTVAAVGSNGVTADVEGLAIARGRGATHPDHLVVSSQGASTYQVFDLASPHTFRKSFTVTASSDGSVDAATGTDGLEITRANLGPLYPDGLLVVHDTSNTGGTASNYKLVDAGLVLGSYAGGGTDPDPEPNPVDRGPSGPVLVWEDDFEGGLNCNIWIRVQNHETAAGPNSDCQTWAPNGSPTRTTFPESGGESGSGDRSVRFEVRDGDLSASGNRSELSGDGASWRFGEGHEGWLQQRIKIDPSYTPRATGSIITQWHAGAGSPPLILKLEKDSDGGNLVIDGIGAGTEVPKTVVIPAADLQLGEWYDIDIHFKMSIDPAKGGAEVFVDGARATNWAAGKTMNDGSSYLKMGIYRDNQSTTGITYVDDVRLTRR